jgi:hypothetical protein
MITSDRTCDRSCNRTSDRTCILTLCRFVSMFAKSQRPRRKRWQFKSLRRRQRFHERPESHQKSRRDAPLRPGGTRGSVNRFIVQTTNRRSRIASPWPPLVIRVRFAAPMPPFCSALANSGRAQDNAAPAGWVPNCLIEVRQSLASTLGPSGNLHRSTNRYYGGTYRGADNRQTVKERNSRVGVGCSIEG